MINDHNQAESYDKYSRIQVHRVNEIFTILMTLRILPHLHLHNTEDLAQKLTGAAEIKFQIDQR